MVQSHQEGRGSSFSQASPMTGLDYDLTRAVPLTGVVLVSIRVIELVDPSGQYIRLMQEGQRDYDIEGPPQGPPQGSHLKWKSTATITA